MSPSWIDPQGRLWGRLSVVDMALGGFLLLLALGILAVQSGIQTTSGAVVEGETDLTYTVLLRHVSVLHPERLFKPGSSVNMMIRNQPRGKVPVVSATFQPVRHVVPKADGSFVMIPDPRLPDTYDFRVTLSDHALQTANGYVAHGIKLKTGMKLLLEGRAYQVPGVMIDIQPTADASAGAHTDAPAS